MTEAQFWGFIRSNLRLMSRKWAPRRNVLRAARRESQSENKRLKWEFQCKECRKWFPQKNVEVDHTIPAGSLRSFSDLAGFVERLLCEEESLVVLCEQCHHAKTHSSQEE
jgi:5-methylcytosine-specific restriction endonuclease McrA